MGVNWLAQLVNQSQTGHVMSNKNATCKSWDRNPDLEIINSALYHCSHPNQKSTSVLHWQCNIE